MRLIVAVIQAVTDLERIGGHAKNVAEHVSFIVQGIEVRHVSEADAG